MRSDRWLPTVWLAQTISTLTAVEGILAALYERQRTGKGRLVECSLLETAIGFNSWTSAQWLADHREPTRQGSCHRQNAPYQRIATAVAARHAG
jgi:crotonobetainyl-CoA:carnitine CoA-transferase CaiB-like acyl-CoA transferase